MISAANEGGLESKSDGLEENRGEGGVSEDAREEKGVDLGVVDCGAVDSMGVDSVALGGEFRASGSGVDSESGRSEEDGVRVCSSASWGSAGGADEEMEPRAFEFKSEKSGEYRLYDVKGEIKVENDPSDAYDCQIGSQGRLEVDGDGLESRNSSGTGERKSLDRQYDTLLSEFDEYVANEKNSSIESGMSRALSYGFEVGDMVWGKVKSHPWWPGQIFNEAFASFPVRRSRRDGYVLVAFFGDSSYGWFDPAELIPFEENFIEKSSQTASRTFVKAVEEAMDEASRRSGLGLACRCRNAFSFRPTHVQGYFAVDVPDYEQGGLYSAAQISKARNSFQPWETLAFIEQLALMPRSSDENSLEFVKNKAIVFAYRKAVFEEYDETYAQAFGVQAVRPSHDPIDATAQPVKEPPRALLSGPLVIAEALGGKRMSTKPMKVKDPSKKDKYLFKRRDDSSTQQTSPLQANSSVPATYLDGSSLAAAGGYILQKRAPSSPANSQIPVKLEQTEVTSDAISSQGVPGNSVLHQVPESSTAINIPSPSGLGGPNAIGKGDDAKITNSQDGFQQKGQELYTVQDSGYVSPLSADVASSDGAMMTKKKKKVLKHPAGEPSSQNVAMREKKKKKRKEVGSETDSDHPRKRLVASKVGVSVAKAAGKLTRVDSASREESYADKQKKSEASRTHPDNVGTMPTWSGNAELDLRQLLNGLQALALDPFYGIERSNPAVTKQAFLRFRSLVYQKSLVLAPPSEIDTVEIRPAKSPAGVGAPDQPTGESGRKLSSSKLTKPPGRFDDPTKSGRKRPPSDRQEEIESKRLKKINNIKSLAAEKRAIQKTQDAPRGEGRETVSATPKQAKPFPVKKVESHPARASDPTILVMKFPPGTSLPSVTELKARFARFGPLDYTGIRVFWKSSTCRVVFHRKLDAEAAYKYAAGNNNLFGNAGVRYSLRNAEVPPSEASESVKGRGSDSVHDTPRLKDPSTERPGPASTVQLKSCLKKSSGDDAGVGPTTGNGGRAAARVKFMLGGEETSRQEPKMMVDNANNFNDKNNNASFADGGASLSSSSSLAMVYNSKNFQRAVSSSPLPPLLPFPPLAKPQLPNNNASLPTEIAPSSRSAPTFNVTVDISQQMISLLTRCNDVVNNLSGLLGYVPYHPL
ncbi:PWWP domain-containing protein 1 isoform X1 [Rhodamnia argentea]|uniref:PWWP domain-containing protein 1 isoform X1 n=1 Tax=Rhodamnia argentea TaxID=178133 RepID=A0A8B8PIZ3_9MYRT|nr:PWWP domain-containing protein 1 isoform X1 [Rhodamnia argentea]